MPQNYTNILNIVAIIGVPGGGKQAEIQKEVYKKSTWHVKKGKAQNLVTLSLKLGNVISTGFFSEPSELRSYVCAIDRHLYDSF